jgi:peptidoglycan/xylan/chitin deacetylase (PgdA/CDA1 family)
MSPLDTLRQPNDIAATSLASHAPAWPVSGRRGAFRGFRDWVAWPLALASSSVLHYSGLLGWLERRRRTAAAARIVVLAYHRVSDDLPSCRNLCVSPSVFRKQMEYIAHSRYRPISLATLAEGLEGRSELRGDLIAITFDDGYRDVFTHALPALREFGVPATIFLTTGWIDAQQTPWWDRLGRAVARLRDEGSKTSANGRDRAPDPRVPQFIWQQCCRAALCKGRRMVAATDAIIEALKPIGSRKREEILAGIEAGVKPDHASPLMLTWEMVRAMRGDLISFGAHTVNHPLLSQVDLPEIRAEIADSKRRIEAVLGEEVTTFAYPNGASSVFNEQVTAVVRAAGLKLAFTMTAGANRPGVDPLSLKRYGVPNIPAHALAARLRWLR